MNDVKKIKSYVIFGVLGLLVVVGGVFLGGVLLFGHQESKAKEVLRLAMVEKKKEDLQKEAEKREDTLRELKNAAVREKLDDRVKEQREARDNMWRECENKKKKSEVTARVAIINLEMAQIRAEGEYKRKVITELDYVEKMATFEREKKAIEDRLIVDKDRFDEEAVSAIRGM